MLEITIQLNPEGWDEEKQEFIPPKEQTLKLEHSLVSLSKWESKWCKSFISTKEMTREEIIDYIKCMTITQNVKPEVYEHLTDANINKIFNYMDAPMTATFFSKDNKKSRGGREIVTNELIYYWMISLNIPFECEKWHLNRLFTLIQVCNVKNEPAKKMSKREIMSRNTALNAARRKKMNSKG